MNEHEDWLERDDEIVDELRRRAKMPEFPAAEIEARIRSSLDGAGDGAARLALGLTSERLASDDAREDLVHSTPYVRPGRRKALGAASEESETALSDGQFRDAESGEADWTDKSLKQGRVAALTRSFAARAALTAAASLALFIAGAESGRRTAPISVMVPAPSTPTEVRNDLPYSIQSAGSQYVAMLATFSGQADSLSPEERRVAREVALAALYSASLELLREAGDDEMLRAVTEMVAQRRDMMGPSTID